MISLNNILIVTLTILCISVIWPKGYILKKKIKDHSLEPELVTVDVNIFYIYSDKLWLHWMVFELFFYNVTIRSDYLDAENRLVLFTIYFLYQYKNSVYYIRFGFLRICRCKNWSHTSKLDPRHQRYRVDPIMGPSAHCRVPLRKPTSE